MLKYVRVEGKIAINRYRILFFFFSSRRRHTRSKRDWSSDVCSSDLTFLSPPASTAPIGGAIGRGAAGAAGGFAGGGDGEASSCFRARRYPKTTKTMR